jgi:uncharacterized protein (DUF58 family)
MSQAAGPANGPSPPSDLRRQRLTREGWYWLFAAVNLLGTGLFKGINLIILLGCLMLVVWLLHWFSSARRIRLLRGTRFLEEPIFAGRGFTLETEIHNPSRSSQAGLVLSDRGPEHEIRWPVPHLPAGATHHFREQIICDQRGPYLIGPLIATSRLPFGLTERAALLAPNREIIVLPRLGRIHRGLLRRRLNAVNLTTGRAQHHPRRNPTAQADLHGLRAFRSGDSPRWIHWRTTARKSELMIREFEEMPTDNLILILDPRLDMDMGRACAGRLLEMAISLTASICWEWCRQTGDRLVLGIAGPEPVVLSGTTGRDCALRMLRQLAVQPGTTVINGEALLDRLSSVGLPPAPVIVVGSRSTTLSDYLTDGLRRPVAALAGSEVESYEFWGTIPEQKESRLCALSGPAV